jgi:hypothetical protein
MTAADPMPITKKNKKHPFLLSPDTKTRDYVCNCEILKINLCNKNRCLQKKFKISNNKKIKEWKQQFGDSNFQTNTDLI